MEQHFPSRAQETTRRRARWGTIAGVLIGAFLLGGVATWMLFGSGDVALPELVTIKSEESAPASDLGAEASVEAQAIIGQQGEIDQRISELEQRLARLNVQADAAAGNAVRAEGLLIAFAARRAIERGDRLGYLAEQLRMRFGTAEPRSVDAVLAADRNPVTLDRLLAQLDGLAPHLGRDSTSEGTFDWISRELGELFVVRREDAPSPAPVQRLERARLFLESGRTESAIAEVRNLPNAERARAWIVEAQRYAAAQRGLERIEAAAILEPDDLRDGTGQPVQQPGAATGP
jgi:hypothetical protein